MYVRTGGMSGCQGMGDTPATCYYWTQDRNGQVVCGDIGGGPALIQNPTNNPDLAQITIDELAGQVGQYASMYAGLMGAFKDRNGNVYAPDSNNIYAKCAQDYFRKLVTVNDVFASDSTARLNRAANQAVKYVMYGCGSTLPGVQPGQFNQTIAAQLTPNAYGPFLYCDDRSPAGKQECQRLAQIAASGDFDFVSVIAGTGTPVSNPLHNAPPINVNPSLTDWYADFAKNNPGATVAGGPSGVMTTPAPQPVAPTPQTYYSPGPAASPANPAQSYYVSSPEGPAPPVSPIVYSGPSGVMTTNDPTITPHAPIANTNLMNVGGNGTGTQTSTGTAAGSAAASSAVDSATSWISSNPLLAAGIAVVAAIFMMGGGKR